MKKLTFAIATIAAALALSACKESPDTAAAAKASAAVPVSTATIQAEATGFTVGSTMSARTVFVFFDPQCPHCAALWESAKPLKAQAKFIWIPVALMGKASETQGAALLASKNPVTAMDEHEASMAAKTGGIVASGDVEAEKAKIAKNTALMTRFGFASIPTIVAQNAQTGALVTNEGAMPTLALAKFLGLDAPSN